MTTGRINQITTLQENLQHVKFTNK